MLRLSKCFYRDTPQAVDLDRSYSGCMHPLLPHVLLSRDRNDTLVLEPLMFFSSVLQLQEARVTP